MQEYYEGLVKEHLEVKGFVVRTNVKYKTEKGRWSDIDILALKSKDNVIEKAIIGEVKSKNLEKREIKKIAEKFRSPPLSKKIKKIIGDTSCEYSIYCWDWENQKKKQYTKDLKINPVSFDEVIKDLTKHIEELHKKERAKKKDFAFYDCNYPNLMLIQFLIERSYLLPIFSEEEYQKLEKIKKIEKKKTIRQLFADKLFSDWLKKYGV